MAKAIKPISRNEVINEASFIQYLAFALKNDIRSPRRSVTAIPRNILPKVACFWELSSKVK